MCVHELALFLKFFFVNFFIYNLYSLSNCVEMDNMFFNIIYNFLNLGF
jgi:hypothetical protein